MVNGRGDAEDLLRRTAHAADAHPLDKSCILVYGGYGSGGEQYRWLNDLVVIRTTSCEVERLVVSGPAGSLPPPRGYHTLTTLGGRCYVVGGRTEAAALPPKHFLAVFDAKSNAWLPHVRVEGLQPEARSSHRAVALEDRIVYYGGTARDPTAGGGDKAAHERLDDVFSLLVLQQAQALGGGGGGSGRLAWSDCDAPPPPRSSVAPGSDRSSPSGRSAHSLSLVGSSIYVLCGYAGANDGSRYTADAWALDLDVRPLSVQRQEWQQKAASAAAAQQHLHTQQAPQLQQWREGAGATGGGGGGGGSGGRKRGRDGGDAATTTPLTRPLGGDFQYLSGSDPSPAVGTNAVAGSGSGGWHSTRRQPRAPAPAGPAAAANGRSAKRGRTAAAGGADAAAAATGGVALKSATNAFAAEQTTYDYPTAAAPAAAPAAADARSAAAAAAHAARLEREVEKLRQMLSSRGAEVEQLQADKSSLRSELADTRSELVSAKTQVLAASAELQQKRAECARQQGDLQRAEGHVASLSDRVANREKLLDGLRMDLEQEQQKRLDCVRELNVTRQERDRQGQELAAAESKALAERQGREAAEARAAAEEEESRSHRDNVVKLDQALKATTQALEEEKRQAAAAAQAHARHVEELQHKVGACLQPSCIRGRCVNSVVSSFVVPAAG